MKLISIPSSVSCSEDPALFLIRLYVESVFCSKVFNNLPNLTILLLNRECVDKFLLNTFCKPKHLHAEETGYVTAQYALG